MKKVVWLKKVDEIRSVISIFVILSQSELIQKWDREPEEIQIVPNRQP